MGGHAHAIFAQVIWARVQGTTGIPTSRKSVRFVPSPPWGPRSKGGPLAAKSMGLSQILFTGLV